jgi:hypothetical protein
MHAMPPPGGLAGHGDVAPPLLLPLPPPLPLLLPPDPPLELALLDPEPACPSLPASVLDVNVLPPQPAPATPTQTMTAAEAAAPNQSKHRM